MMDLDCVYLGLSPVASLSLFNPRPRLFHLDRNNKKPKRESLSGLDAMRYFPQSISTKENS